jgi:hypothetical protein
LYVSVNSVNISVKIKIGGVLVCFGYVDWGTGSMLIQAVIGTALAAVVVFRNVFRKLISKLAPSESPPQPSGQSPAYNPSSACQEGAGCCDSPNEADSSLGCCVEDNDDVDSGKATEPSSGRAGKDGEV